MKYLILFLFVFLAIPQGLANSYELSPNDYLFKNRGKRNSSVFDKYRTVDLGVDLSSGVDCGRLDLKGTLKSALDRILDPRMFGHALDNIASGAPLLTICYFSPTWCSIAKHFRINAQNISQLRLNQCALMDKYVDSRVEDYYAERQSCLHRELQNTGGNHEKAIALCGSGLYHQDLANWAGKKFGGKVQTNKLIESSAKWAGFTGPTSQKAIDLVKAFVGDTTVTKGHVSVEYGSRKLALSPKSHLVALKDRTYKSLCGEIMGQIAQERAYEVFNKISDKELKVLSNENLIDKQSLYYLAVMPPHKKELYCEKLAASVAMSQFSNDVEQSLQILRELVNNPNLPPSRKRELQDKRRALKDSVEMVLHLEQQQNKPINLILAQINQEGRKIESNQTHRVIQNNTSEAHFKSLRGRFFDCADGVYCDKGGF